MRAAVYQGVDTGLTVEQVADPTPGLRDVVLKVERCGVCGSDVHMTDGVGMMECPAGMVLGHEYAGEVVEVGREVTSVAPGDRVHRGSQRPGAADATRVLAGDLLRCVGPEEEKIYGSGAYAEYARTVDASVVRLPSEIDWELGALVEPLAVALHGVELACVQSGDVVTTLGAGPIALSTVAWLRSRGVDDVTVVATSRRRETFARELGASAFMEIDPADPTTHPQNADVVFEAAGTQGAIAAAFGMARSRGSVVSFGFCDVPDAFIPALVLIKELRLQFSMMYDRHEFETTVAALEQHLVDPAPMISRVVSLDDLPTAFGALARTERAMQGHDRPVGTTPIGRREAA